VYLNCGIFAPRELAGGALPLRGRAGVLDAPGETQFHFSRELPMRALIIFATGLSLGLTTGCTTAQYATTEKAIASAFISDADEEQLGDQIHQELSKPQGDQPALKYLEDAQVVSYVQGLVDRLKPYAQRDRNVQWKLHVVDDLKTVNAFTTPGAHIYVFTGLLANADNEAEVTGVLAHEMGHVVARHAARQLVNTYGIQTVLSLALGKDPGTLQKIAAAVVGNGALLAHSRADENEADGYAVRYSAAAGYDPRGIAMFFQKLLQMQGKTPKVLTWLSTHPATEDRITHVNQVIATERLSGSEIGAERLAPIKQRLGPAPVSSR
jgi:predicted Zn-dependent protease